MVLKHPTFPHSTTRAILQTLHCSSPPTSRIPGTHQSRPLPPHPEPLLVTLTPLPGPQDFLDIYVASMKVLVTEDDFYSLATQYLARAHEDNIKVAEISFDPQGHIARFVHAVLVTQNQGMHRRPFDGGWGCPGKTEGGRRVGWHAAWDVLGRQGGHSLDGRLSQT